MDKLKKLFELKKYPIDKQKSSLSEGNPQEHKENTVLVPFYSIPYLFFVTMSLLV